MKLRIQADDVDLSQKSRTAIDGHFRIALGNRSAGFQRAKIVLSRRPDATDQIRCRISLSGAAGALERVDETASDVDTAMELAIWRLIHSLDRRALRASDARQGANRPGSTRRSRAPGGTRRLAFFNIGKT